jgi:hypothetical protein
MMNAQICCNDMFYLETAAPNAPEHLQLVRATMNGVEIQWAAVPTANEYLLQIYKVPSVESEQPGKICNFKEKNSFYLNFSQSSAS